MCRRLPRCAVSVCVESAARSGSAWQCASVWGGSRISEQHPTPHTILCQQKIRNFHIRFKLMQRTAREGINTFPKYKVVTLPQRPFPHMDLEAFGKITYSDCTQAIPSRPVFSKTWIDEQSRAERCLKKPSFSRHPVVQITQSNIVWCTTCRDDSREAW